jgi:hypothetical protein
MFGAEWSCIPMSAGRSVGYVGIMLGGSSWTYVLAEKRFARGANLVVI